MCEEKGEMNSASWWQRSVLSAPLESLPPRVSRKRPLSLGCCLPCRHSRLTVRICFAPTDCKQGALNQTSERGQGQDFHLLYLQSLFSLPPSFPSPSGGWKEQMSLTPVLLHHQQQGSSLIHCHKRGLHEVHTSDSTLDGLSY